MHVFAGFESHVHGFSDRRFRRGLPGLRAVCAFNTDVCAILEDPYPVMRDWGGAQDHAGGVAGKGPAAGVPVPENSRPAIRPWATCPVFMGRMS
jgi:hypothetical protein